MKILLLTLFLSLQALAFDPTVTLEYKVKEDVKRSNILFVIDNSGSMNYHQQMISDLSSLFLKELKSVHYKITAISTDKNETVENLVVYKKMPDPLNSLRSLLNSFGTNGSAEELILDRVVQFRNSKYGKRFLNNNNSFEVIALSDEDEQSELATDEFITKLGNKKAVFSGIVSGTGCPQGQSQDPKFEELALKTGGMLMNICQGPAQLSVDYMKLAKNIVSRAKATFRKVPVRIIVIKENINIDSIKVFYGSQIIKKGLIDIGWVFNATEKSILIGRKVKLDINQPATTKLTVKYDIQ